MDFTRMVCILVHSVEAREFLASLVSARVSTLETQMRLHIFGLWKWCLCLSPPSPFFCKC